VSNDLNSFPHKDFLLEEYKILSTHYFHEDNYYLRTVGLFGTINVALLTIYGSRIIPDTDFKVHFSLVVVGIISSVAFGLSLTRVRYLRRKIEERMIEIETNLNNHWGDLKANPPFAILSIRNRDETPRFFEFLHVAQIMLFVPASFLLVWVMIWVIL
jgi:hypothetical protein